jgi:hypothetical protein
MVARLISSLGEDCLGPSEVDVGRGEVVDAFVIADVVIMPDEGSDLSFEIAGQVIIVDLVMRSCAFSSR